MMFPPPDFNQCVAYQGNYTGAWYVLGTGSRFFFAGPNAERALELASIAAKIRGWMV
jgi:hypothetical protein